MPVEPVAAPAGGFRVHSTSELPTAIDRRHRRRLRAAPRRHARSSTSPARASRRSGSRPRSTRAVRSGATAPARASPRRLGELRGPGRWGAPQRSTSCSSTPAGTPCSNAASCSSCGSAGLPTPDAAGRPPARRHARSPASTSCSTDARRRRRGVRPHGPRVRCRAGPRRAAAQRAAGRSARSVYEYTWGLTQGSASAPRACTSAAPPLPRSAGVGAPSEPDQAGSVAAGELAVVPADRALDVDDDADALVGLGLEERRAPRRSAPPRRGTSRPPACRCPGSRS